MSVSFCFPELYVVMYVTGECWDKWLYPGLHLAAGGGGGGGFSTLAFVHVDYVPSSLLGWRARRAAISLVEPS